jgi:hypothetical protein
VDCFATQRQVIAGCGRDLELFRPAPAYDFRLPPHSVASLDLLPNSAEGEILAEAISSVDQICETRSAAASRSEGVIGRCSKSPAIRRKNGEQASAHTLACRGR